MITAAIILAAIVTPAKPLAPVPFTDVTVTAGFWADRLKLEREHVIPHELKMCAETGRITNFEKAASFDKLRMTGGFEGIFFNDSDLYKVIEGAAYVLALKRDPELESQVDSIIEKIAAAQQPDGYLYTFYTVNKQLDKRFTDERDMHETYCAGHLFEGAVAYYQATGKRKLLDVATRVADCLDRTFGPEKLRDVPGHEEVELALIKLWRATKEPRYLKLAQFWIDERGHYNGRTRHGEYDQDQLPVKDQREIVGHAVRAMYLFCGVTDLAAISGDPGYATAADAVWHDVTERKMYVTGGIGPSGSNEGFTTAYDLPNQSAYCETCAAIGLALWSQRMALLHRDAKYADVVERVLYNGFLSGLALDGEHFFYVNPLASFGQHHREPWFGCACCPPNVARYLPAVAGLAYATGEKDIYVNQYIAGVAKVRAGGGSVALRQTTEYPWDGRVKLTVSPAKPAVFALRLRVPGWCQGPQSPDDLYHIEGKPVTGGITLKLNGTIVKPAVYCGYAVLNRQWKKGDVVDLNMPMPVRRVTANPKAKADVGRVALQRGPIVYCLEQVDNAEVISSLALPPGGKLTAAHTKDMLGGVTLVQGRALARYGGEEKPRKVWFTAVPYYAWDNRAPGQMAVWMPADTAMAQPRPIPTIASQSKATASFYGNGTITALNDQMLPSRSNDPEVTHFTWWPHKGGTEWIQYDFKEPATVSGVEVYWFDDTGTGECRLPRRWRLLYDDGGQWKPVQASIEPPVVPNGWSDLAFAPVLTRKLRLEADLVPGMSGGLFEWRVLK